VKEYIYRDIGGSDRFIWFILGNLLAVAGICPFVGSLSDLLGRRWVAIFGAALLVLGMIVASSATNMNNFIGACSLLISKVNRIATPEINVTQPAWSSQVAALASTSSQLLL